MIRIKDIAKEANVSEGTVDRVLHNRGGVSKKTEEKIRAILERSNYSINPVASALAQKHHHHIATLTPNFNKTDSFWKSPYLGILKASEEVQTVGIETSCFKYNQYKATSYLEAFYDLLLKKPTAVVVVPMFLKETKIIVEELETLNIPYTFLNIDIDGFNNLTYVGQDSYTSGFIAAKLMHLKLADHSKLLTIKSREHAEANNTISKRIQGFNDYFESHTHTIESVALKMEDFNDAESTQQTITSFLMDQGPISGIFVPSSRTSVIVDCLKAYKDSDFHIIGFDNTPQNVACLKNDTADFLISQKPFDQGYEAIRIMTDFLLKAKTPEAKTYLPIDILIKENVIYNDINQLMFENSIS